MRIWPPHSTLSRNGEDLDDHGLRPLHDLDRKRIWTPPATFFPNWRWLVVSPTLSPFPEMRKGDDTTMHSTPNNKHPKHGEDIDDHGINHSLSGKEE